MATITLLPKGTKVRQKVKAHEGVIDMVRFKEDEGAFEYHVTGKNADGDPHGIWFAPEQLDVVAAAPTPTKEAA